MSTLLTLPLRTTLGAKYVMALTGFGLICFVLVHMAGNLLIFAGPDALDSYAEGLKAKPPLLWFARSVLLFIFTLHLGLAYRLWQLNTSARPIRYVREDTLQASWASRHMMLTGLVLLAFIIFHLAHFTFGLVTTADVREPATGKIDQKDYLAWRDAILRGERLRFVRKSDLDLRDAHDPKQQDVYNMVVAGFSVPWITLLYVIAQIFLCVHLWHGGSSWFQSLGLNHPQYNPVLFRVGPVIAVIVLIGNCSIPLAVLCGAIKPV